MILHILERKEWVELEWWIYKRTLLLLTAYGGIFVSLNMFPDSPIWSISHFIGEVLFSPFKLLLAILLFIVGFLSYSLFVRDGVKIWNPRLSHPILRTPRMIFIFVATLTWLHLFFKNGKLAVLALGLALWYGIMDVSLEKNNKWFK
ncbi:hypothetical protein [Halalkalibacter akibai]|uniref:Uncharacterized protein n=1 Tax=Halalkalibacter akibai (strain ATCC 43226 / DSM 21942 / CIP 109018 / JCM 9157 / 1139) TaxID=1236973 RepID=W4QUQ1_HALA3|nr:hypothetical protein [Halalkalibacter akibai]GAE35895.1 hypothetical protein JCM9157_3033 [Halalkalibacter akibai JCM 9157]